MKGYKPSARAQELFEKIVMGDGSLDERQIATKELLDSWELEDGDLNSLREECLCHGLLSKGTVAFVFGIENPTSTKLQAENALKEIQENATDMISDATIECIRDFISKSPPDEQSETATEGEPKFCAFCGERGAPIEYRSVSFCPLCVSFDFPKMTIYPENYTCGDLSIARGIVKLARIMFAGREPPSVGYLLEELARADAELLRGTGHGRPLGVFNADLKKEKP